MASPEPKTKAPALVKNSAIWVKGVAVRGGGQRSGQRAGATPTDRKREELKRGLQRTSQTRIPAAMNSEAISDR